MIKGGLGKGLGALLSSEEIYEAGSPGFFLCPIEKIRANPQQPRKKMDPAALATLAASIRDKGVLQPLVVRPVDDGYELVAGERRWRASQQAGLRTVPVVIKDVSPDELLELALIENIQRQDLNPIEEAMAYQRLIEDLGLTQAEAAKRVGRDRATVANFLRLLQLPDYAREDLLEEKFTMGHAKALLMVTDPDLQRQLRDAIIKKKLSVRKAEALARRLEKEGAAPSKQPDQEDPDIVRLCEELTFAIGSPVKINRGKRGGRLEIRYDTEEELERIISILKQ
jgi:ParB family chromosome partitioning protein